MKTDDTIHVLKPNLDDRNIVTVRLRSLLWFSNPSLSLFPHDLESAPGRNSSNNNNHSNNNNNNYPIHNFSTVAVFKPFSYNVFQNYIVRASFFHENPNNFEAFELKSVSQDIISWLLERTFPHTHIYWMSYQMYMLFRYLHKCGMGDEIEVAEVRKRRLLSKTRVKKTGKMAILRWENK